MITVKMTEVEYQAYLAEPENRKEFEAGLEDVKEGRVTYIDPENLWESIK